MLRKATGQFVFLQLIDPFVNTFAGVKVGSIFSEVEQFGISLIVNFDNTFGDGKILVRLRGDRDASFSKWMTSSNFHHAINGFGSFGERNNQPFPFDGETGLVGSAASKFNP